MTQGTARYIGEEITATFTARGVRSDYGVPRSPTWTDWEDVEIQDLELFGVKVDPEKLPADLQEAIRELSDELEFEMEDF